MCLSNNQENRDHHHDNNGIGDDNVDYYDDYGGDGPMTTGPGQENRGDPRDNDDDNGECTTDIRSKELGCNACIKMNRTNLREYKISKCTTSSQN